MTDTTSMFKTNIFDDPSFCVNRSDFGKMLEQLEKFVSFYTNSRGPLQPASCKSDLYYLMIITTFAVIFLMVIIAKTRGKELIESLLSYLYINSVSPEKLKKERTEYCTMGIKKILMDKKKADILKAARTNIASSIVKN